MSDDFKTIFMSDSRTTLNFKYLKCPTIHPSIHPWFLSVQSNHWFESNVVIVEESFGSVSRWLKSSCPSAARWRECLWGDEIFAILFRNAKWKVVQNSLRNCGVDLHLQHWNLMVNSSLGFSNVINPRRCCVNLQTIWHMISTWANDRSRGLKLLSNLPKCRRLLALPVRMYPSSHAETPQR